MTDTNDFRATVRRVRAGDEQAAADLVRRYEPLIRREVRLHLENARLRRLFDSVDVVQSVLASFFIRTAAGEYDLDSPQQLAGLLVRMTRNKLASALRKQYRVRRDARRTEVNDDILHSTPADDPTPSEQIASQDLLEVLRSQLTSEERRIANLRADGCSWNEVAIALGGTAQARRMQLARGVERAAKSIGFATLYD